MSMVYKLQFIQQCMYRKARYSIRRIFFANFTTCSNLFLPFAKIILWYIFLQVTQWAWQNFCPANIFVYRLQLT